MSSNIQPGAMLYTQGFGSRPENVEVPVIMSRNPASTDVAYPVGKRWVNTVAGSEYTLTSLSSVGGTLSATWALLGGASGDVNTLTGDSGGAVSPTAGNINVVGSNGIKTSGSGSTLTITPSASGFPITPFVVGPVGQAGYQTIASAITAANAAGGGIIYVQPGTYTENLTLTGNIEIVGVPGNSDSATAANCVIISGVHTPPTSGSFTFANCHLVSATHIFSSAAAGSATLVIINCSVVITSGFIFNLANWTGNLVVYDLGDTSTNNGVVNNAGGATCFFISATLGAGTGQTMSTTGPVILQEVDLNCPWTAATGTTISCDYVIFTQAITAANNSTGSFRNCTFNTGSSAALTMSSSAAVSLLASIISSSNNPAIAGSGAGTLTLGDITFTSNSSLAGTLTLAYAASKLGATVMTGNSSVTGSFTASTTLTATSGAITATNGNLVLNTAGNKIVSTSVASTTTAGANSFGSVTLVGGTATVNTTSVTANSLIYIWRQSVGATGAAALGQLSVGTIVASTSFVINAWSAANATSLQASDVSVIGWMIVN